MVALDKAVRGCKKYPDLVDSLDTFCMNHKKNRFGEPLRTKYIDELKM